MPALLRRMTARDTDERERVSSPLELLFDLCFVVAVSQAAAGLAHSAEAGDPIAGLAPYAQIFFAIWWAWMNFTWFASAYDTDDAPYRVLTLLQMAGALVLAAGVPVIFAGGDLTIVTVGYAIMRLALVAQWLRAAAQHPEGRSIALRYALFITIVQVLWIARLFFPWGQATWLFVVLALCEVAVPPLAELGRGTAWHAHHIGERYGLFVIILLGESVLAATVAFGHATITPPLVGIGAAGLVILFALWWIYFAQPAADGLERHRERSFYWGYGHYFLFASLAAVGAGLEVAVSTFGEEHPEIGVRAVAFCVATPIAVVLVLVWALHRPLGAVLTVRGEVAVLAAALVVGCAIVAPFIGLPWALGGMAFIVVLVVASTYVRAGAESGGELGPAQ